MQKNYNISYGVLISKITGRFFKKISKQRVSNRESEATIEDKIKPGRVYFFFFFRVSVVPYLFFFFF